MYENVNVDEIPKILDIEWESLFAKLNTLCMENRFEVRKASITTFADMFVNSCNLITYSNSSFIIQFTFFKMILKAFQNFEGKVKKNRAKVAQQTSGNTNNTNDAKPSKTDSDDIQIGEFKADMLNLPGKNK